MVKDGKEGHIKMIGRTKILENWLRESLYAHLDYELIEKIEHQE